MMVLRVLRLGKLKEWCKNSVWVDFFTTFRLIYLVPENLPLEGQTIYFQNPFCCYLSISILTRKTNAAAYGITLNSDLKWLVHNHHIFTFFFSEAISGRIEYGPALSSMPQRMKLCLKSLFKICHLYGLDDWQEIQIKILKSYFVGEGRKKGYFTFKSSAYF